MRCKRCGSTLNYEDVMCKGCGKSLVDLKAKNEIEFDDNATINIEPIKNIEVPKVEVEEKKVADVFGDAIYNQEEQKVKEVESVELDNDLTITEVSPIGTQITNAEPKVEQINAEPINATPLPIVENEVEDVIVPEISVNSQESIAPTQNTEVKEIKQNISEKEMSDEFVTKKKSKKGIIFVIITLIVLALAAVVVLVFIKTDPKSIFQIGVNKLFSYGNLETITSPISKGEAYLKLNIDSSNNESMYDVLNNLSIDLKTHIDKPNKNLMVAFDSKYDNSSLIKATIYGNNNELYVLLEKVYEKYIGFPIDEKIYNKLFEDNDYLVEIETILKELNKEINASLEKKYFSRSVRGTDTISTFNLTKEEYVEFIKKVFTNIKNNNELIKSMALLSNQETSMIQQNIDNQLSTFNEGIEVKIEITSSIIEGKAKKIILNLSDGVDSVSLNVDVVEPSNYKFTLKNSDETINGFLSIADKEGFKEYSFTIEDEDIGKVTYIIGCKFSADETLVLPYLTNKIEYTEITTEESDLLLTNLFQNEGIMKLYEAFSTLNKENIDNTNDVNIVTETDGTNYINTVTVTDSINYIIDTD